MASRGLIVGSFAALTVFMLSFCAANGLTCYQCYYDTQSTPAGKQFCNATLQVCDEKNNETYCSDVFAKRNDSSTLVDKGCANPRFCADFEKECEDAKKNRGYTECSLKCCQGDLCNTAFVSTTISTSQTATCTQTATTQTSTTMLVFGLALVFFGLS